MPTLDQIHIRDPYLLFVAEEQAHYLFGTTDETVWSGPGKGFDCYRSTDLHEWSDARPAFRPPADFWATQQFWAPEVHRWNTKFVMFATFAGRNPDGKLVRGTQSLISDRPDGPYEPLSYGVLTPPGWLCLDGTLFVDDDRTPWLLFCREWLDIKDGQILAQQLSEDLSTTRGEPRLLFRASEAAWTVPLDDDGNYVTDGPFIQRMSDGGLAMLWSSRTDHGYAVGTAYSETGTVLGPWTHDPQPLWDQDGGHAMTYEHGGETFLVLHQPNDAPNERAVLKVLLDIRDPDGKSVLRVRNAQPAGV